MSIELVVRDCHAQMGTKASKINPEQQVPTPVYQIVIAAEHGETQYVFNIITTSPETYDKYSLNQKVEIDIRPVGKRVLKAVEDAN